MRIHQGSADTPVLEAILHCLAVPTGWAIDRTPDAVLASVRHWHRSRGWRDVGYHYIIMPDGHVITGRPVNQIGAHTIGKNKGTLGIAMVESVQIDKIGVFSDYFTEWQKASVVDLVYEHNIHLVSGHNDYAAKLCPGFKVKDTDF